uniref:Uncharacterized protein n=1 Tax=Ditylenchus dipsaci TaxID=166011 RepID=A0A915DDV5_9BILA
MKWAQTKSGGKKPWLSFQKFFFRANVSTCPRNAQKKLGIITSSKDEGEALMTLSRYTDSITDARGQKFNADFHCEETEKLRLQHRLKVVQ